MEVKGGAPPQIPAFWPKLGGNGFTTSRDHSGVFGACPVPPIEVTGTNYTDSSVKFLAAYPDWVSDSFYGVPRVFDNFFLAVLTCYILAITPYAIVAIFGSVRKFFATVVPLVTISCTVYTITKFLPELTMWGVYDSNVGFVASYFCVMVAIYAVHILTKVLIVDVFLSDQQNNLADTIMPGNSVNGLYTLLGITGTPNRALANDFILFIINIIVSDGDALRIALAWATFGNVLMTRSIKLPGFAELDVSIIEELMRRTEFLKGLGASSAAGSAQYQSGSLLDNFATLKRIADIFTGELASKLISLVSLLCGIFYFATDKGFTLEQFSGIEDRFRKESKLGAAADVLSKIVECISYFFTRGSLLYASGDFGVFTNTDKQLSAFTTEYERIAAAAPTVMISKDWYEQTDFLRSIHDAIDLGGRVRMLKTTSGPVWKSVSDMINKLNEMSLSMRMSLATADMRAAPFAIRVAGESGQLKSTFLAILRKTAGEVMGIGDEAVRNALHWLTLQDGFDVNAATHKWCTIIDEAGMQVPQQGIVDPVVAAFICYANNIPYIVPKPDLPSKGMVSYNGRLMLLTTNHEDMYTHHYLTNVFAFERRLGLSLVIKLKDEYKNPSGTFKGGSVATDERDYWIISVRKATPDPKGSNRVIMTTIMEFTSISKFLIYFADAVRKHEEEQRNALNSYSVIETTSFCARCKSKGLDLPENCCECREMDQDALEAPINGDELYADRDISDVVPPMVQAKRVTMRSFTKDGAMADMDNYVRVRSPFFWTVHTLKVFAMCILYYTILVYEEITGFFINLCRSIIIPSVSSIWIWRLWVDTWRIIILSIGLVCMSIFGVIVGDDNATCAARVCARWATYLEVNRARPFKWLLTRLLQSIAMDIQISATHVALGCTSWFISPANWVKSRRMFAFAKAAILGYTATYLAIKAAGLFTNTRTKKATRQSGEPEPDDIKVRDALNGSSNQSYGAYDIRRVAINPLSLASQAQAGQADNTLKKVVSDAMYRCRITALRPDGHELVTTNNAFKLSHGCFGISSHAVPTIGPVCISFYHSGKIGDGSLTAYFSQDQITRDIKHDLAIVHVHFGEASKIENFFAKSKDIPNVPAKLFTKRPVQVSGTTTYDVEEISFSSVTKTRISLGSDQDFSEYTDPSFVDEVVGGVPDKETINGDCAGLLVCYLGSKDKKVPVICGMHMVSVPSGGYLYGEYGRRSYSVLLTDQVIKDLKAKHLAKNPGMPTIDTMDFGVYQTNVTKNPLAAEPTLHQNNMFLHIRDDEKKPKTVVYGQVVGMPNTRFKTNYFITDHRELIEAHGFYTTKEVPRLLKSWAADANLVRDLATVDGDKLPTNLIEACAEAYLIRLNSRSHKLGYRVFSFDEAVNGTGKPYEGPMNFNTSGGFGNTGPKRRLLVDAPVEYFPGTDRPNHQFVPGVHEDVARIRQTYLDGNRAAVIYNGALKDEPMSAEKLATGKIRYICASPLAFSIIVRQYFGSVISFLQNNRDTSEVSVGIAAQSNQWEAMYNHITHTTSDTRGSSEDRSDRIVAGDFKGFDKNVVTGHILYMVCTVLWRLVEPCLDNDDDRKIVVGILNDISNPILCVHGTLFMTSMNPSGNPLTVLINCIGNSIVLRAAFVINHPMFGLSDTVMQTYFLKLTDSGVGDICDRMIGDAMRAKEKDVLVHTALQFGSAMTLFTYGDDMIGSIAKQCHFVTQTSIAAALSIIGIQYTNPDKTDPRIVRCDLMKITNADFLKRNFVPTDLSVLYPTPDGGMEKRDVNIVLAPLKVDSLGKMLIFQRHSNTESRTSVLASSLTSFLMESAQHGREFYTKSCDLAEAIIEAEGGMQDFPRVDGVPFDTFDGIIRRFYLK
jgi:hypothetical protein